jgi:hypothetical protein
MLSDVFENSIMGAAHLNKGSRMAERHCVLRNKAIESAAKAAP